MRKRCNRKIRDANLKDYNTWLAEMATTMEEADKRGDSETIFRVVKIVSGLLVAASSGDPSVDSNGDLILDQHKMAEVWKQFLEGKFEATAAGKKRDDFAKLGPQITADPRTEQACVRALRKPKRAKLVVPTAYQER